MSVTASIRMTRLDGRTLDELLAAAENALLSTKGSGGNSAAVA